MIIDQVPHKSRKIITLTSIDNLKLSPEELREIKKIILGNAKIISKELEKRYKNTTPWIRFYAERAASILAGIVENTIDPFGSDMIWNRLISSTTSGDTSKLGWEIKRKSKGEGSIGWELPRNIFDEILLDLQRKGKIVIPENRQIPLPGGGTIDTDDFKNGIYLIVFNGYIRNYTLSPSAGTDNRYSIGTDLLGIDMKFSD